MAGTYGDFGATYGDFGFPGDGVYGSFGQGGGAVPPDDQPGCGHAASASGGASVTSTQPC